MTGDSPAAELDALLGHAALRGRWPEGFTSDDVLAALTSLGHVDLEVRDVAGGTETRFVCRLQLRDAVAGGLRVEAATLTAAMLRCLIEAESELATEVARGLRALGELLGGA